MDNTSPKEYQSVYDRKFQDDIWQRASEGSDIEEIIQDIEQKHRFRREVMRGMYRRAIGQPASYYNWFDPIAADGVPIKMRKAIDPTKVNTKVHTPFDRTIATNKASYMVGTVPEIESEDEVAAEALREVLEENDFQTFMNERAQSAARSGSGYSIFIKPKASEKLILSDLPDWQAVIIYNQVTRRPEYALIWYEMTRIGQKYTEYKWYDEKTVSTYQRKTGGDIQLLNEEVHGVGMMPVIEWPNNTDRIGDVELTINLQDAYDICQSDLLSEISQLRLAYLVIKGSGEKIDSKILKQFVEAGIIAVGPDGDVHFTDKQLQSEKIQQVLDSLEMQIYHYSNSYNPSQLAGSKAMTAFQIEQMLFPLEQSTKETELMFKKSLSRLAEIVLRFHSVASGVEIDNSLNFVFSRNVPRNEIEDLKGAREAGWIGSQKRIAAHLPFTVDQELNEQELDEEMMGGGEVLNANNTETE